MLSKIRRRDRTHQPPQRVTQQTDSDDKQDCGSRWLAGYLFESAVTVSGSRRSSVKRDIGGKIRDQKVDPRSGSESGPCKKLEPSTALNESSLAFNVGNSSLRMDLRLSHS
jgi:hypothetical protein